MGLTVSVGMLADLIINDKEDEEWLRDQLEAVYSILSEEGLPSFTEPEVLSEAPQYQENSFSYSCLHFLRRAYALQHEGLPLTPADEKLTSADDKLIEDAGALFDSHLLTHSDFDGFYVPVDFPEPIFDDEVQGATLGSSQGLLRELIHLAPFLSISLTPIGKLTEESRERLRQMEDANPYAREYLAWYTLYEAARFSIDHSTMIVYQ